MISLVYQNLLAWIEVFFLVVPMDRSEGSSSWVNMRHTSFTAMAGKIHILSFGLNFENSSFVANGPGRLK